MNSNIIKIKQHNDSKIELILVGTKPQCKKLVLPNLTIGDVEIKVCSKHAI